MSKPVLVAYASRHGSTREIAEAVVKVLAACGLDAVAHPAEAVETLTPYRAVVLGSAVYEGDWLAEASDFVRRFADDLAQRPLWLFSSGTAGAAPTETMQGWTHPRLLGSLFAEVHPRGHAVFGGRLDPGRLSVGDWWRYPSLRGVRGDFRNWQEIGAWAEGVAGALTKATA